MGRLVGNRAQLRHHLCPAALNARCRATVTLCAACFVTAPNGRQCQRHTIQSLGGKPPRHVRSSCALRPTDQAAFAYLGATLQLIGGEHAHELRAVLDAAGSCGASEALRQFSTAQPDAEADDDDAANAAAVAALQVRTVCQHLRMWLQVLYVQSKLWTATGVHLSFMPRHGACVQGTRFSSRCALPRFTVIGCAPDYACRRPPDAPILTQRPS